MYHTSHKDIWRSLLRETYMYIILLSSGRAPVTGTSTIDAYISTCTHGHMHW